MIDISDAQLEPFRAFHFFHESINIHIKVSLSASLVLVRDAGEPSDKDGLYNLIRLAHPAWNTPPIRGLSLSVQREMHRAVSSFAVVAVFSAFDDLLSGTDAELSRFGIRITKAPNRAEKGSPPSMKLAENEDDNDVAEKLLSFYERYDWKTAPINKLLPLLRYFRFCRDCIVHRSSRVSRALSEYSKDDSVQAAAKPFLDKTSEKLPQFDINGEVFLEPTHAIMCSHILRTIAEDCNKNLIRTLGIDGFVRAIAHHTMFGDWTIPTEAYRNPESVFNYAATDRYRARLESRNDSIVELKRLGIWKEYTSTFERKYRK